MSSCFQKLCLQYNSFSINSVALKNEWLQLHQEKDKHPIWKIKWLRLILKKNTTFENMDNCNCSLQMLLRNLFTIQQSYEN